MAEREDGALSREDFTGEQLRAAYEAPAVEVEAPKPESKVVTYLKLFAMALLGFAVEYIRNNGLPF